MPYSDPEKFRAYQAAWKLANPEKRKAYAAAGYIRHREREIARSKEYRETHREAIAAHRRQMYEERQKATNAATHREYGRRNPGRLAEIENRRRARFLGAFVETISAPEIRDRDGGLCGICHELVPVEGQSLDHVIPLSRGGKHERANVQLAHRSCNARKGNRRPAA